MKNSKLNVRERAYQEKKGKIKTLFLGDSHGAAGINTRILESGSFNFCSSGENYLLNYSKLKHVLLEDKELNIKTIVIPYDLHSLSSFRTNRISDDSYWISYVNYWEEFTEQRNLSYFSKWITGKFFSYAGNSKNINHFLKSDKTFELVDGQHKRNRDFSKMENGSQLADVRASFHLESADLPDELALHHLEKLVKFAKQHNRNVVMIRYPIPTAYLESANSIIDVDRINEILKARRNQLFPGIPYLDFQDIFKEKPELFDDPDHLNYRGAEIFSKQLLDSLTQLGLN